MQQVSDNKEKRVFENKPEWFQCIVSILIFFTALIFLTGIIMALINLATNGCVFGCIPKKDTNIHSDFILNGNYSIYTKDFAYDVACYATIPIYETCGYSLENTFINYNDAVLYAQSNCITNTLYVGCYNSQTLECFECPASNVDKVNKLQNEDNIYQNVTNWFLLMIIIVPAGLACISMCVPDVVNNNVENNDVEKNTIIPVTYTNAQNQTYSIV